MEKDIIKTNEVYTGKVRLIEGRKVRVSLYDSKESEIIGEFPRKYFPINRLSSGMTFHYNLKTGIEMIKPREPSKKELSIIRDDLSRKLKGIDLDII